MVQFLKKITRKTILPFSDKATKERIFLNKLYDQLMSDHITHDRVKQIMTVDEFNSSLQEVLAEDERALPGNCEFLESGWYKSMLTRYALGMFFSEDKKVLDTCSGLGWGAYLLETVAKELICIELDAKAINAAKKLWDYQNCKWIQGSVTALPFPNNTFDVVTAMESIEHFTLEKAGTYIDEVYRVLKPKGRLVGSTPLPINQEGVRKELETNPYHLHVFTPKELEIFLQKRFRKVHLYQNNRFFWAIK